ncbi:MAG: hypothetical protein COA42_01770 [Alteromonadaceae bacterium]|nr:MAG: hypothetical protein COA42_01770 [Alteromonadaceae bacterium]
MLRPKIVGYLTFSLLIISNANIALAQTEPLPNSTEVNSTEVNSTENQRENVKHIANSAELEVIDSFLEMHTGPGRAYPVFFVVEQSERIIVLSRRPDWYEVKTVGNNSKTGWVKATQIVRTLQNTGEPVNLPGTSYGDFAKNRWRIGFFSGQLKGDTLNNSDVVGASLAYYPLSWLGAEVETAKFFSNDARGTQIGFNLIVEPFSRWRLSPALIVGAGQTKINEQPRIVPLEFEEESHQLAALRLNYYAGRNFIIRAEYRQISVDATPNSEELDIWSLGFSTLF